MEKRKDQIKFPFVYYGNKYEEMKRIEPALKYIDMDNIDTIVEPFAGSFGFTRSFYRTHFKDKTIKLYDINNHIVDMMKIFKNNPSMVLWYLNNKRVSGMWKVFKTKYNSLFTTEQFKILYGSFVFSDKALKIKNPIIYDYSITFNLMRTYKLQSYKKTFTQYKNNARALLFLDPPYFDTNIELYKMNNTIEEIYNDILDLLKTAKCRILMVVREDILTKKLFNDHTVYKYAKIYNVSKKKATHLVIVN